MNTVRKKAWSSINRSILPSLISPQHGSGLTVDQYSIRCLVGFTATCMHLSKTSQQLSGQFTKFREYFVLMIFTMRETFIIVSLFWAMESLFLKKILCIEIPLISSSMVSIKTPNPKCRLYWYLIEFIY
jgi:hypothetical protein